MNKDRLIEALETALAELKQPAVTFTPPKREPLGARIEVPSGNTDYVFGFCDGVLYAEKEHGIGE